MRFFLRAAVALSGLFFAVSASGYAHTEGGKSVVMFVCDYPDAVLPKTEAALQTDANALFKIGQTGGLDEGMRRNSYGKCWFTQVTVKKVRMANPKATYAEAYYTVESEARAITGIAYNDYDRTMTCAGGIITSTGLAYLGGRQSYYNNIPNYSVGLHELGHNQGLPHANFWQPISTDPLNGNFVEYGSPFDNMGGGSGDWNALEKTLQDHLTETSTDGYRTATVTTSGTYRLAALDSTATSPGLIRGLKFPRTGSTGDSAPQLWACYRQVQFLSNFYSANGLHISLGFNSDQSDSLLDMNPKTPPPGKESEDAPLLIGRTFYDVGANAYLTPLGKVAGSSPPQIDVQVTLGPVTGNTAPTATLAASDPAPAASASLTLTATATDVNGDSLAYSWDFGDGSLSSINSPTQVKSYPTQGIYLVKCTVSDLRGGSVLTSMWINVGNAPASAAVTPTTLAGFNYRYYEGSYTLLPNFSQLLSKKTGTVANIDLSPRERNDSFAFLYEGYIDVATTDIYTFTVRGDDGYRFSVDGTPLIFNDGVKSLAEEKSGNVSLAAGKHSVRLEYFHNTGNEELTVSWNTLGNPSVIIPSASVSQLDPASNAAPSVSVTVPLENVDFTGPTSVQFQATASDANGIAKVQYFFEGSFLGESTTAPYNVT